VLTTLELGRLYNRNPFAVGPDGTVYVGRPSGISQEVPGTYLDSDIASVPSGGGPMTQVPGTAGLQPDALNVVGGTLYFKEGPALYSIPTTGGTPSIVSSIPGLPVDGGFVPSAGGSGWGLGTHPVFDSTHLFLMWCSAGATPNAWPTIWSLPIDGGAGQQILPPTQELGLNVACESPVVADPDSVFYFFGGQAVDDGGPVSGVGLYQLSKVGGQPALVNRGNASTLPFGVVDQMLYMTTGAGVEMGDAYPGQLTRFVLEPNAPAQSIPMIGGWNAQAIAFAATDDGQSGYAALTVARSLSGPLWIAIAPLPTGDEHVKALACWNAYVGGVPMTGPSSIDSMAIDSQYVYAMGATAGNSGVVVRVHR
jgi:hypothetical protein